MSSSLEALTIAAVLIALLGAGVWIGIALLLTGWFALWAFTSSPPGMILATAAWESSSNWTLTALPLFIWMGEILYRTRLAQDMFNGLAPFVQRLPGRLAHVNVAACGIFAAVSGSSAATTATIGRISLPELKKRGYDDWLAIGSLAGAGTLGLLIPPSIVMIVYGVAAQVSINRLFVAGILPGLLLMMMFSAYIVLWALRHPDRLPQEFERTTLAEKLSRSRLLIPVVGLIVAVIGSIYAGIATATEAAALGVLGALVIAALSGGLTWASFTEALMGAVRTSCMIGFILLGAAYLTRAMSFSGLPADLAALVADLGLDRGTLIFVLTLFFIVLGMFLDGISIVVLTTSVVLPAVSAVGIDPLWFGIYLVIVVEMAQITPPLGFNLFVIQGLTGRGIFQIAWMTMPFFLILCLLVVLITVFPGIVTALTP